MIVRSQAPSRKGGALHEGKHWRQAGKTPNHRTMPFMDPTDPERPLTLVEIRAMLDRARREAEAGQGTDLNLLLAQWETEDGADQRARQSGKPSAV